MRKLFARYRAYLIAKAESADPFYWLGIIRFDGGLWIIPIMIGGLICYGFDLDERGRIIVMAPFGLIGISGMIYVGWVVAFYGIRAARERNRVRGPSSGGPL